MVVRVSLGMIYERRVYGSTERRQEREGEETKRDAT